MFDFDNFREIWSTIQKNKLRTFLTGFSVAWGIFMLIVLLGAGNGMKNGIMSNFRNFSLNRVETWPRYTSKPYKGMQMNRRIEYKDEDLIAIPRENPEVDLITASISRSDTLSYGDEYNAYSLNGVHPSKAVIDNIEMTVGNGRFINDIDVKEKRKVIVLSPRMKEVLFKGEDPLGKYVNAGSVAYQVIGVYKAEDNDNIDTIYVEDENGRYFGAIELKDLITAREYMKLEDIISTSYPYVYADERSSDCMEELIDYSEDSIPVLDRNHKIIGAITYEDIAEAIDDEMGDDYAKLAGLTSEEDLHEPLLQSLKKRLPWLVLLLFLGMGVSSVVGIFEPIVDRIALLICFQSMILDMAGNVGTQSLAVTIRVLMDEDISAMQKLGFVFKEMRIGFLNGLLLGSASFVVIGIFVHIMKQKSLFFSFALSGCVGISLLTAMVISSLVGVLVPMLFHKLKVDPAVASGPLITTVNDLVAVVTYYGLAEILLVDVFHLV